MPDVTADRLRVIAATILEGAGAPPGEAATVARGLVGANLAGHDSHGVRALPEYVERIRRGHIVPGAPFEVIRETSTTTVIDGHWGFGFVVSERAMATTVEKAKRHGVAAATVARQGHVGRVAAYPLMAAREGLIGVMTADSGRSPKAVAPFGGAVARLGTNPICFAIPSDLDGPFFLDMATSACAVGKIKLAAQKGEAIPEGWIIDAQGRATTDPNDYAGGGVVLPLGGAEGFKGYGLAAVVEVLSGLLTGLGFGVEPTGRHNDGCFMAAFDVGAFRPLDAFKAEVREFAEYLQATPPAHGFDRVRYPGQVEHEREQERLRDGVPIDDAVWAALEAVAAEIDLPGLPGA